ncbi:uncharacterized protein LOC113147571 [Cyclospora cayetanensis]|uniref:Uncharacterized protein LOC113147571 n=1 Tax=Cyclospora cayetanensis TaxID=88456 RepID=A0A6P6S2F6_9EIME|nr:uncharacterized protein LOC113147571 [Cyclospora cayetanensis]
MEIGGIGCSEVARARGPRGLSVGSQPPQKVTPQWLQQDAASTAALLPLLDTWEKEEMEAHEETFQQPQQGQQAQEYRQETASASAVSSVEEHRASVAKRFHHQAALGSQQPPQQQEPEGNTAGTTYLLESPAAAPRSIQCRLRRGPDFLYVSAEVRWLSDFGSWPAACCDALLRQLQLQRQRQRDELNWHFSILCADAAAAEEGQKTQEEQRQQRRICMLVLKHHLLQYDPAWIADWIVLFLLRLYADVIRGLNSADEALGRTAARAVAPLLAFAEAPPTPAQYLTAKRRLHEEQQQQQQQQQSHPCQEQATKEEQSAAA